MMQNRSILQKYEGIYEKQKALRESITLLLRSALKKDQKIETLSYHSNVLKAVISHVNKEDLKRIVAPLKKKKMHYKTKLENRTMQLEISL